MRNQTRLRAALLILILMPIAGCIQPDPPESIDAPPNESTIATTSTSITSPTEELPSLEIQPSHGSATAQAPKHILSQAPLLEVKLDDQLVFEAKLISNTTLIPFLQPSKAYAWNLTTENESISGEFQTTANPNGEWAKLEHAWIQPGNEIRGCTMGFILRDATNDTLYGSTAGHCTEEGDNITLVDYDNEFGYGSIVIGVTIASTEENLQDWAFFKIHEEYRSKTNPSVKHFTGPTGLQAPETRQRNDVICLYGYGGIALDIGGSPEERPKCGKIDNHDNAGTGVIVRTSHLDGVSTGDSGAPVIDLETGAAVGIHTAYSPPITGINTSLCHALEWLQDTMGITLRVATAPYTKQDNEAALPDDTHSPITNAEFRPAGPCSPEFNPSPSPA